MCVSDGCARILDLESTMTTEEALTAVILAMRIEATTRDEMQRASKIASAAHTEHQKARVALADAQFALIECLQQLASQPVDDVLIEHFM